MTAFASQILLPILLLIGDVYSKTDYSSEHSSWPRLDGSAFEVREISGVGGRLAASLSDNGGSNSPQVPTRITEEPNVLSQPDINEQARDDNEEYGDLERGRLPRDEFESPLIENIDGEISIPRTIFDTSVGVDLSNRKAEYIDASSPRKRRETDSDMDDEIKMEKIASSKTVREARLDNPESWSKQPISVEFRHRTSLDQIVQDRDDTEPAARYRSYEAPRADFITSHYRRLFTDNRESRDMPIGRAYEDYDVPWYRNSLRDRDYDYYYHRGYNYRQPDYYRMERGYYPRPSDPYYYDQRYRDEEFDLYNRNRPAPKPKRIIYYATLPEVVRKPIDLRNYPRPYDPAINTQLSRDNGYKRVPGNVDPNKYRYRYPYDVYDYYSKRGGLVDRPYTGYREEESRRKGANTKDNEEYDSATQDRKLDNQIASREESKTVPWPVQIGTEVSVKDDTRIPGRKIFGDNGFERIHSAQLQNAPETAESTNSTDVEQDD